MAPCLAALYTCSLGLLEHVPEHAMHVRSRVACTRCRGRPAAGGIIQHPSLRRAHRHGPCTTAFAVVASLAACPPCSPPLLSTRRQRVRAPSALESVPQRERQPPRVRRVLIEWCSCSPHSDITVRLHPSRLRPTLCRSKRDRVECMWKAAQRPGGHSQDWCADTTITELYAPPVVPGRAWTRFEVLRETLVRCATRTVAA
jgi:hypothetical protein